MKTRIKQMVKTIARYFIKKFNLVELGLILETSSKLKKSLDYTIDTCGTNQINFILDVSGSVVSCEHMYKSILKYILRKNIFIHVILIDHEIEAVVTISKIEDFENIKIYSGGGTLIQPAFDYIATTRLFNNNQNILFTDGYTDKLNVSCIKRDILVISTERECEFTADNNRVEQIIIR